MITLKIRYSRSDGDYAGWNLWVWPVDRGSRQYDLKVEQGDAVATVELPSSASYVNYIVRKSLPGNAWAAQEHHDRRISLEDVVSGNVEYYVNSEEVAGKRMTADDAIRGNKITSAVLDYDAGVIRIRTAKPVENTVRAFTLLNRGCAAAADVTVEENGYALRPLIGLQLPRLYRYRIGFENGEYPIGMDGVYMSHRFRAEFTDRDTELGAIYSPKATVFRLWAPTAESVRVQLENEQIPMLRSSRGIWECAAAGDRNGQYYTYLVTVDGERRQVCDPYARTTGVNGERAMVIDLQSTDPAGWTADCNPNPIKSYTDAVIYELHIRDLSIDPSSGMDEKWWGKFLALTQTGTKTPSGIPTGLDHLKNMGITHLHLLPFYDYGSVDERYCDTYNWGYDPVNFNVPEGSYSTDPFDGFCRVRELKQTIKTLHDNGISVVMDVVYNHVFDAATFCFNRIVPGYFSRWNADGSYSNGSGCGNDTASERDMVRRYIVESVLYWTKQYHIDGFRFDLVGLLDTQTINEIVAEVHKIRPDVIFYGEGWDLPTAVEGNAPLAIQKNAHLTPGFAYFSDTFRDLVGGRNGETRGFACGLTGKEEKLADCFRAAPGWCNNPAQNVQYCSCHDNYTLADKLILAMGEPALDGDVIRRNLLAAASCLLSQGVAFVHAGEELLRQKLQKDGKRCENSYNAPDYVNQIRWSDLEKAEVAQVRDYYRGLIAFRKAHKALRLDTARQVADCVRYQWVTNEVLFFRIDGEKAGDTAKEILILLNGSDKTHRVQLPAGVWNICIDSHTAGTDVLGIAENYVNLQGVSAMVLIR